MCLSGSKREQYYDQKHGEVFHSTMPKARIQDEPVAGLYFHLIPSGQVNVVVDVCTPHPRLCPAWFRRGFTGGGFTFTQRKAPNSATQCSSELLSELSPYCSTLQRAGDEIFSAGVGDNCGDCLVLKNVLATGPLPLGFAETTMKSALTQVLSVCTYSSLCSSDHI